MHAQSFGLAELAVEAAYLTLAQGAALRRQLAGVELVEVTGFVEALRAVKDPAELEILQNAFNVAAEAFVATLPYIRVQMTERDIAARLEFEMRRRGAERVSLETIVASGPRGALPHGRASDRQVQSGELITIDFGCVVKGYCSDVTRTVAAGTPSSRAREIYDIVLQALTAGKAAVRAGAAGQAVDAVARQVIADAGYGDYFVHNLGHSLGLEIHEDPRLARNRPDHILRTGNVVTVEPGIYIPGWGGVRIEDVVTVTAASSRTLTPLGLELIVV
jgi:Xaa-Pro aminopeptidase